MANKFKVTIEELSQNVGFDFKAASATPSSVSREHGEKYDSHLVIKDHENEIVNFRSTVSEDDLRISEIHPVLIKFNQSTGQFSADRKLSSCEWDKHGPFNPPGNALVLEDGCYLFYDKAYKYCSLARRGQDKASIQSGLLVPVHPTKDTFVIGGRLAFIHNKAIRMNERILPIFDLHRKLIEIRGAYMLPNGDLLVSGSRGEVCQVRLDSTGNVIKSDLIGYVYGNDGDNGGNVDHICALPGTSKYIIVGQKGSCLAEFKDDKLYLLHQSGTTWPLFILEERSGFVGGDFRHLPEARMPVCLEDVLILSNKWVVIVTNNNYNTDDIRDYPDKTKRNGRELHFFKISKNDFSRKNVLPMQNIYPSAYLLLPDNKLLFSDIKGNLYLVWDENGVLKHQEIVVDTITESVTGDVTYSTYGMDYPIDDIRTSGFGKHQSTTWRRIRDEEYSTTHEEIVERFAIFHRVPRVLLLTKKSDGELQIFIQRSRRIGHNDLNHIPTKVLTAYRIFKRNYHEAELNIFPSSHFYLNDTIADNFLITIKTN